jgi:hypothetical protein
MIKLLRWLIRIAGLVAFVVGMMLGRAGSAMAFRAHMTLGLIVALSLIVLAVSALSARVRIPIGLLSILWAAALVYVGIRQTRWMPGDSHWTIEVLHAVLGIGAIGLAETMAGAITRRRESLRA